MTPKEACEKLSEVFNFVPSEDYYANFVKIVGKYSPVAIEDAYNHTVSHEVRFPSISLFRDYCSEFQSKIEEEAHKQRKKSETLIRETGLGKQVMQVVRRLMKGELTRLDYIMELKNLGIDCGLMDWYAQNGYDLDGKARVSKMGRKIL